MFLEVILYCISLLGAQSLNFLCQLFGTLSLFHLRRLLKTRGILQKVSKRRHKQFRRRAITHKYEQNIHSYNTRRKFEVKMILYLLPRNYEKLCFDLLLF